MNSHSTWAAFALAFAATPALAGGGGGFPADTNGWAAVTCGTRTIYPAAQQYTFGLIDVNNPVFGPGHYVAPTYHDASWTVTNIGNVFGVTWDNSRNVYVTATSNVEGYAIPGVPHDAVWRYGDLGGGRNALAAAGTVYKIDGQTGAVSVFAQLPQQSFVMKAESYASRQTGPGLGNIGYDTNNNQFFVTNFEDGRIYRIGSNGQVLSTFDPLAPDNGAAGFAPRGERLWGVALLEGRLYYSVWPATNAQPTIRSVALQGGDFVPGTDKLELTCSFLNVGHPVSDISFSADGRMLLGQRTMAAFTLLGDTFSDTDTYNHRTSVAVFQGTSGNWTEIRDWGISVVGGTTPESYGGVDWADLNGVNDMVWASGADMINTSSGSHGVMGIAYANLPTNPADVVGPFSAIPYDPNLLDDAKGIGGDIDVIGRTRPICTGEFVAASVDANLPACNHPTDGVLTADLPVIDSNWCWNLDTQFPGALYWLFTSFDKPAQPLVLPNSQCHIYPNLFALQLLAAGAMDGNGNVGGCLYLPPFPTLVGYEFVIQARICDPTYVGDVPLPGYPDFFSNGVCLKIGCP
jgi:hypothetical protein